MVLKPRSLPFRPSQQKSCRTTAYCVAIIMPPTNNLGDVPTDINLHGDLTLRKGDILDNPRGGKRHLFQFKVSEGYEVLRAKVVRLANVTAESEIYFKRSKSAVQSQFVPLTIATFEENVQYRWSKIPIGDIQRWEREDKTPAEGMKFEFFLYVPKERRAPGIRRATATRIQDAEVHIRQYEDDNDVQLGNIQRNHMAIHFARQPDGTDIAIPQDNTTRQAAALDEAMAQLETENAEGQATRASNLRTVRMEFNSTMLDVRVDIVSLRTALALPQHDLFHEGIYRQYEHPVLDEADNIADIDHQDEPVP